MNNKLEVGMYVRTKHCGLFKILNIIEENGSTKLLKKPGVVVEVENKKYKCSLEEEILKASHNIIDLIKVGDFITLGENNYPLQIINIWEHGGDKHLELSNGAIFEDLYYRNDFKIYSIVTKEQFESMSYKL